MGAFAFDVYGTLFDPISVAATAGEIVPDAEAFTRLWRAKQLEYSWLLSLMGAYRDFGEVTHLALDHAIQAGGVVLDEVGRRRLMGAWLEVKPFADTVPGLERLRRHTLAVLSNGSPAMLQGLLEASGLAGYFQHVISVHRAGVYKPAPAAYALGPEALAVPASEIVFVSSNSFDVNGAAAFGLQVAWLNRYGAFLDPLGGQPRWQVASLLELADLVGEL